MLENWRPVVGLESCYEVSDTGRVRSLPRTVTVQKPSARPYTMKLKGVLLRPGITCGYHVVALFRDAKQFHCKVAALVAAAFIGPRPDGYHVCHRDGVRTNDSLLNLYYGTPVENNADKQDHGTQPRGEKVTGAVLTQSDVRFIRANRGVMPQRELADMFGVAGQGHISMIQSGKVWKHVE